MLEIRDIPEDLLRALSRRAAESGRDIDAEVREILQDAVQPASSLRMGQALEVLGRKIGLADQDLEVFDRVRSRPAAPVDWTGLAAAVDSASREVHDFLVDRHDPPAQVRDALNSAHALAPPRGPG